jgi:hypothetical protein
MPPDAGDEAAEQQQSQSDAALENVREGYGR